MLCCACSYYTGKHNGRRLQWHPYLGHCTLRANFPAGRKELVVSLLQAIVLLLFNAAERLAYVDILASTGMEDKELKVTLQSLACGKQVGRPSPPRLASSRANAHACALCAPYAHHRNIILVACARTPPDLRATRRPDAVLTPTRCLPDAVLLGAVVCGQRVLRKEPKGRDVDDTDEFHYDASFKHNLFRIKINSIQMRENEQENEQVHARARPAPCPPEPELSCAMVAYAFAARARRYCASQPTHAPRIFGPVRACVLPLARVADDGRRRSASSRTASIKSTRRSCAR